MDKDKQNWAIVLNHVLNGMKKNIDNRTGLLCFIREIEILAAFLGANDTWNYGAIINVFCPEESEEEKNA